MIWPGSRRSAKGLDAATAGDDSPCAIGESFANRGDLPVRGVWKVDFRFVDAGVVGTISSSLHPRISAIALDHMYTPSKKATKAH